MAYFTHYWATDTVAEEEAVAIENGQQRDLGALVSRRFDSMGVVSGDVVYVICWTRGMLRVISSLVADRILDESEARRRYGGGRWSGFDHLEGEPGSGRLIRFDVIVPEEEIGQIEFETAGGGRGPKLNRRGGVDPQTFRGVRRITEATAIMFDGLLDA